MSLDNNSANNFKDFLEAIKPYLNYQLYDCSGMGIDAFRFSATEKPVGQWTDGKLIYQKTVDCGTMPNNTVKTVAHGIQNLDKVVRIEGIGKTSAAFVTMPCLNVTNVNAQIEITVDATNIYCNTKADRTGFGNVFITLFYTKTTDSPLANDEKFAGVTSDGEVIYQKTLTNISWAVPANAWGHYSHGISNVKRIVDAEVFFGENLAKYGALGIGGGTDGKVDICGNADARTMSLAILKYIKTS